MRPSASAVAARTAASGSERRLESGSTSPLSPSAPSFSTAERRDLALDDLSCFRVHHCISPGNERARSVPRERLRWRHFPLESEQWSLCLRTFRSCIRPQTKANPRNMQIYRRTFLKTAAVATAGLAVEPVSAAESTASARPKLGISTYSYWHFRQPKIPV